MHRKEIDRQTGFVQACVNLNLSVIYRTNPMAAGGLIISGADYARIMGLYFSGQFLTESSMEQVESAQTLNSTMLDISNPISGNALHAQYRCFHHCSNTYMHACAALSAPVSANILTTHARTRANTNTTAWVSFAFAMMAQEIAPTLFLLDRERLASFLSSIAAVMYITGVCLSGLH